VPVHLGLRPKGRQHCGGQVGRWKGRSIFTNGSHSGTDPRHSSSGSKQLSAAQVPPKPRLPLASPNTHLPLNSQLSSLIPFQALCSTYCLFLF
jgi:hypothetical protein